MVNIGRLPVQTPDALPFVGDIPGKKGQFVAAGYNGHGEFVSDVSREAANGLPGMARIFLCAPSLASYILEGEWDAEMPKSFQITPERIEHLKKKVGNMKKDEVDAASRLGPALEKVTL